MLWEGREEVPRTGGGDKVDQRHSSEEIAEKHLHSYIQVPSVERYWDRSSR